MKRRMSQRYALYFAAVACIVGGGLVTKFIEATSGAALIAGGTLLLGMLQKQLAPSVPKDVP